MIRPLELAIGLRYTRAKRRNRFISFISLVSMLGIALGVVALVATISVMNGLRPSCAAASWAWWRTPRSAVPAKTCRLAARGGGGTG